MYKATLCGEIVNKDGRFLKTWVSNTGYRQFHDYSDPNHRKTQNAHRFVYEYFHGKIEEGLVVDHINGIRTDNRINNLQKITQSENNLRGKAGKLKGGASDREAILELYNKGYYQREIAEMFGIDQSWVSKILKTFVKEGV